MAVVGPWTLDLVMDLPTDLSGQVWIWTPHQSHQRRRSRVGAYPSLGRAVVPTHGNAPGRAGGAAGIAGAVGADHINIVYMHVLRAA